MRMYDLAGEWLELADMETEIDADTFADTMESIEAAIEDKADAYAAILNEFSGTIAACQNEIRRLTEKKKALETRSAMLKENLTACMVMMDRRKIQTGFNTFTIQANPPSVAIQCPIEELPAEYIKYKDPEPDKTKLKAALKLGAVIPGVELVQTEGVRIR